MVRMNKSFDPDKPSIIIAATRYHYRNSSLALQVVVESAKQDLLTARRERSCRERHLGDFVGHYGFPGDSERGPLVLPGLWRDPCDRADCNFSSPRLAKGARV